MSGLRTAVAFCVLAIPVIALADDWHEHVPEDWVLTLEIRDIDLFDRFCGKIASVDPWFTAEQLLVGLVGPITDRPIALVVCAPQEDGGDPKLMLLAPVEDFDAFCEKVGADRAEGLAVFKLFGEMAACPAGEWVAITPLESIDLLTASKAPAQRGCDESNVIAVVSPAGIELLQAEARKRTRPKSARRRKATWPTSLLKTLDQLADHGPLLDALAEQGRTIALGVVGDDPDTLRMTVEWDLSLEATDAPVAAPAVGDEIATLAHVGRLSPAVIELLLAAIQSSSLTIIEATEFPDEPWRLYAEASRSLLNRVESPAVLLASPSEDEPIAANQSATFAWTGETSELGDAILEVVARWNQMMRATKTRSPITAVVAPLSDNGGWRVRLDVFGLGERDPLPEERKILNQFYGHDHGAQLDIVPIGESRWLATFADEDSRPTFDSGPVEAGAFAAGQLRVDRWIAWESLQQAAVRGQTKASDRVMEAPPASFRAITRDGRTVLEASLPWDALKLAMPRSD